MSGNDVKLAHLYLYLGQRFGWTPAQVNEIDPHVRLVMADLPEVALLPSINEMRANENLPPVTVEQGRRYKLDDPNDGATGAREAHDPEPQPVAPATMTTTTGETVEVTLRLDGAQLFRSMLPHIERENQRWKLRYGRPLL